MNYPLRVSLDGGVTWQHAPNGVRATYTDLNLDDGRKAELALNITRDGVISEVWAEPIAGESELSHLEESIVILPPGIPPGR